LFDDLSLQLYAPILRLAHINVIDLTTIETDATTEHEEQVSRIRPTSDKYFFSLDHSTWTSLPAKRRVSVSVTLPCCWTAFEEVADFAAARAAAAALLAAPDVLPPYASKPCLLM